MYYRTICLLELKKSTKYFMVAYGKVQKSKFKPRRGHEESEGSRGIALLFL